MQLHRFDSVEPFWQQAQEYLLNHEAEHNALLGNLHTLLHCPERRPASLYFALVQTKDTILAIAIRTATNKILLSKAQDLQALTLIAQDVVQGVQHQEQVPGVGGLVAEVEAFVDTWQTLTGQSCQRTLEMRIHQLTQVEPVPTVSGALRRATESDRPLLIQWFTAFDADIGMALNQDVEQLVDSRLQQQNIYLWEDGVPVSMVGGKPFSATAGRIAPVYTPPEYRRKGYATASVAALSQKLLDEGCDRCFLFTDLANPTSNHIYQQVGYRPICDWHDYSFTFKESA
ncbi:MAG TPA: GNAT family N-acetyltransferase [Crinalium sp.]